MCLLRHLKLAVDRFNCASVFTAWHACQVWWVAHAPCSCRRKSVVCFNGRPAPGAAMPVLHLLSGPEMGFSPRRGDTLLR